MKPVLLVDDDNTILLGPATTLADAIESAVSPEENYWSQTKAV